MEDLLGLGMTGLNPIEPEAMDIFDLKRKYGRRLTLIGNVDINNLSLGTPESVYAEVERKLRGLAPGGRYVIASSTSIPEYVKPENYRAMLDGIRDFGDMARLDTKRAHRDPGASQDRRT
jgi:uroporphyrinogen decarboxylase